MGMCYYTCHRCLFPLIATVLLDPETGRGVGGSPRQRRCQVRGSQQKLSQCGQAECSGSWPRGGGQWALTREERSGHSQEPPTGSSVQRMGRKGSEDPLLVPSDPAFTCAHVMPAGPV